VETLAKRRLVMVTGRCHPALAMDIADKLGITLTEANLREFADGEIHCRFRRVDSRRPRVHRPGRTRRR